MKSVDTKRDSTSSKQFELLQENVENENYLIEHNSNDSINHNKKKKIFQHNTKQNLLQQGGHDCKKCIWKYHFKVYKLKKISCEIFFMCKSIIC